MKVKVELEVKECQNCPFTDHAYEHGCYETDCTKLGAYAKIPRQGFRPDCPLLKEQENPKMIIDDKNYSVWYQYENMFGITCNERLQFDTEEDADKFIQDLLHDYKSVWNIIKTTQTIYYPKAEKR